ncbi:MAG: Gfo/Idh/MocA family oxidoreductase [Cyanobacteriota bacterium]
MNIAVIGSGYWGKNIVRNYSEIDCLYAICEIDEEKRKLLAEQYPGVLIYETFDKLLADKKVEGIAIATPAHTHFELARKSLEAGFPTYVEKPITLNLEDAEALTKLAEEKQLPLMVGHILEYHPAIVKMKELISKDTYGKVKHIKCTRVNLGKIRVHENIWWSFAPHDLSIIFTLIDEDPEKIQATSFDPLQPEIEDTVYADLNFASGKSAHIQVSWLEPIKLHQTIVVCEKAFIVFNDTHKEDKLKVYNYSLDKETPNLIKEDELVISYEEGQPLKLECTHFIDCIKNNKTPKTDGRSACRIIKVIEYVDKELKKSSKVKV